MMEARTQNLSGNQITDLAPLNAARNLLSLTADDNAIGSIASLQPHPFLQVLSLRRNQLTQVKGLVQPQLERLTLSRACLRGVLSRPSHALCRKPAL
jgi:Leucine-rich repeat (LRR) protein